MHIHTDFAVVGRIKPWEAVINKGVKTAVVLSWSVVGIFWLVGSQPPAKKSQIWLFISCVLSTPLLISSEIGKIILMVNVLSIIDEYQHCLPWEWTLHWGHLFPSWDFWWCGFCELLWLCGYAWTLRLGWDFVWLIIFLFCYFQFEAPEQNLQTENQTLQMLIFQG